MGHTVTFEHKGASVSMDVWCGDKIGSLELVSSKYKKRGLATHVVRKAVEYADFLDLELVLTVQPFGTPGNQMEEAELKAWYMTFGFHLEGDGVMARKSLSARNKTADESIARTLLEERDS